MFNLLIKKIEILTVLGSIKKKPIGRIGRRTTFNHRFVLPKPIGTAL